MALVDSEHEDAVTTVTRAAERLQRAARSADHARDVLNVLQAVRRGDLGRLTFRPPESETDEAAYPSGRSELASIGPELGPGQALIVEPDYPAAEAAEAEREHD